MPASSSRVVKQSERQVDRSPSSIVKVKDEWHCISTAHVWLYGVDKQSFTFSYYCFLFSLATVMLFVLYYVTGW